MSREWKPGDVAVVRSMYGDEVTAIRTGTPNNMGWSYSMRTRTGSTQTWHSDATGYSVVRPLVVIDPDDEDLPIAHAIYEALDDCGTRDFRVQRERIRAALRSLIEPPKPDEPTGLGAVVLGSDGNLWVAGPGVPGGKRWEPEDGGESRYYRDVPAISEMSVGVEPMADWERDLLREVER